MKNLKLQLKENINLQEAKKISSKEFIRKVNNSYSDDQNLIYLLIHRYSNYEQIMWRLYQGNKKNVIGQIKSLLIEITKLDKTLSWDCQIVLNRYKKTLHLKHLKSEWILKENIR